MNNREEPGVFISIDTKKFRIRVSKYTLHLMGDPKYIQLLVNPAAGAIAIRGQEHEFTGDQTQRVEAPIKKCDTSVEFYSKTLVCRLIAVSEGIGVGKTYRINGEVKKSSKVAVFYLKDLLCIDISAAKQ